MLAADLPACPHCGSQVYARETLTTRRVIDHMKAERGKVYVLPYDTNEELASRERWHCNHCGFDATPDEAWALTEAFDAVLAAEDE